MIAAATGGSPVGDIGTFAVVVKVQDFAYLIGGLVFGIALFRARVLSRSASVLLAVSGVVTVVLSLMPDALYRLLAFPNGIAMIGLGVSLWFGQRNASAVEANPSPADDQDLGSIPMNNTMACTIRVDGHLDDHWSARLADLAIAHNRDGTGAPSPGPSPRYAGSASRYSDQPP